MIIHKDCPLCRMPMECVKTGITVVRNDQQTQGDLFGCRYDGHLAIFGMQKRWVRRSAGKFPYPAVLITAAVCNEQANDYACYTAFEGKFTRNLRPQLKEYYMHLNWKNWNWAKGDTL